MALVVEASVGPGKLIICSADIATDLENRPVARQLRYSLLQYMRGTTFRPETELEEDDIRRLTRDGVTIQLGNTRQTIHRFGASDCWTAKFIGDWADVERSEEHTAELRSLIRHSYALFCLKK